MIRLATQSSKPPAETSGKYPVDDLSTAPKPPEWNDSRLPPPPESRPRALVLGNHLHQL